MGPLPFMLKVGWGESWHLPRKFGAADKQGKLWSPHLTGLGVTVPVLSFWHPCPLVLLIAVGKAGLLMCLKPNKGQFSLLFLTPR